MVANRRDGSLADYMAENPNSVAGSHVVIKAWKRDIFKEALNGNIHAVRRALQEAPEEFTPKEVALLKAFETCVMAMETAVRRLNEDISHYPHVIVIPEQSSRTE